MSGQRFPLLAAMLIGLAALAGCGGESRGPIRVSAIGDAPRALNPNLDALDPPAAFLAEATAQGLVRFDGAGEIEPALAQSWIVSDDGLRYTMRIRPAHWADGGRVTADQVAARLRAALSRASRNPLKLSLGAVESVVPMTDEVIEIKLRGPRPNFLQLLAQPEMAITMGGHGTGPYRVGARDGPAVRLALPRVGTNDVDDDQTDGLPAPPAVLLRGEPAPLAIARFLNGDADLVTGGTIADLPYARRADIPASRLALEPVQGMFGLVFLNGDGALRDAGVRRALAMAVDREGIATEPLLSGFEPRTAILPTGVDELPSPARPDWADQPLADRRAAAAAAIRAYGRPVRLRIAVADTPGHRLLFAHLRRDWAAIGVTLEPATRGAPADLAFVDQVAPLLSGAWYLRHFHCEESPVCDPEADAALEEARAAPDAEARRAALARADRILTGITPWIALGRPVRWSLAAQRLNGFHPNQFARHPALTLVVPDRR